MALVALAAAVLLGAGCDAGLRDNEPLDLPPVKVLEVVAVTGVDSHTGGLEYSTIYPVPPGGVPPVLPTTSLRIRVDRLLLPPQVDRQDICLQDLPGNIVSAADCVAGVVLSPSYDPVRREVVYRQALNASLSFDRYELTIYAATGLTDAGLRSFDGIPLAGALRISIPVQSVVSSAYDDLPKGDHFCGRPDPTCKLSSPTCARSVFGMLQGCALGGCHADSGSGLQPAEGLSFTHVADILATAINRPAHETETGESAITADETELSRFGRAMPVLEPSVPGNSYLIYKLLANRLTPLQVPFTPRGSPGMDPPEVARLRDEVVVGMPMPPSTTEPATMDSLAPPRPGEPEWLVDWLLQDAPMPAADCPPAPPE
jgi:hypothetical protein